MAKRVRCWKTGVILVAVCVLTLAASAPSLAQSLSQVAQWYAAHYGATGPVIVTTGGTVSPTTVTSKTATVANSGTTGVQTTTVANETPVTTSGEESLLQYYLGNYAGNPPTTITFSQPAAGGTATGTAGTATVQSGGPGTTSALPSGSAIWSGYSASYSLNGDEQQLLSLVNQQRVANHLPAFTLNLKLSYLARLRAQEMANIQTLTHYLPVYGTPPQMEEAAGIYGNPFGAENICEGPSVPVDNQALFNSPPHRANLLDPQETQIGLGVVRSSNGIVWVSELFLGN